MDLHSISGVPMHLAEDGKLEFEPDVVIEETKVRLLDELTPVFLDQATCRNSKTVAYYMFNGVYCKKDQNLLADVPMRYELTLFPDLRVGREYVKTLGHIHMPEPKSRIDYPEICEVLIGTAHFFFQKFDRTGWGATEAFYIEVKAGEKILIEPGYDHLTINPGPGPMLFSDVIALGVSGNYQRFKVAGGAAYLEVEEQGRPIFVPNPKYHGVPDLKKYAASEYPELDLTRTKPLYTSFVETRGRKWPFLNDPRLFPQLNLGR